MPNEDTLKKTPLHKCHLELGAKMVPFAGYEMPVQYAGVLEESKATRANIGLFDVSHMGQFSVKGTAALQQVNRLVTNDLDKLSIGQAQYNVLCQEDGGAIDDLIVYRRAEDWIYICVNASNIDKDFEWMRGHLPADIVLENESDETALIAVQGPKAETLLSQFVDAKVASELKYYWATEVEVLGQKVYLSRTGYTGEDGFELYTPKDHGAPIWEALMEKGKSFDIAPIGLGARDTLRLEMGYALYGHELDETVSPIAAGLGWTVKVKKQTPFIGQSSLIKEREQGSKKYLKAFVIEDRRIPRQGYPILNESETVVGVVTSGTMSPQLGSPIALGFVDRATTEITAFQIQVRNQAIPARIAKLPFVPSHVKK